MTAILIPRVLRAAMPSTKFLRNTAAYPDAAVQSFFNEEANRICRLRVKELATFACPISALPASKSAERTRWRFAFHSSTHASALAAEFVMATASGTGGDALTTAMDPYGKLVVDGVSAFCTARYGTWPAGVAAIDTPQYFRALRAPLADRVSTVDSVAATISADTDYTCTISDVGFARTLACTVYEVSKDPDTANGYLSTGVVAGGAIGMRSAILSILRRAWKRNAAQLWNWASNTDATAPSQGSTTAGNWIDLSLTSPSAASPGATLDLRYRRRRSATTVPCKWKVYAENLSGTGTITLRDADNTVLATHSVTTAGWYTTTVNLPATLAKYDLFLAAPQDEFNTKIFANSLYQYDDSTEPSPPPFQSF